MKAADTVVSTLAWDSDLVDSIPIQVSLILLLPPGPVPSSGLWVYLLRVMTQIIAYDHDSTTVTYNAL